MRRVTPQRTASEAAGSAYADDGAGDGVSSANRDAEDRVDYKCEAAGSFRGESAEGRQLVIRWPMVLMMRQPPPWCRRPSRGGSR